MGMCEGNCSQTILYVYRHTVAYTPAVYIKVCVDYFNDSVTSKKNRLSSVSARRVSFKQL